MRCCGAGTRRDTAPVDGVGDGDIVGSKLLTPVPPSNTGKSQREMFPNTADCGGGFPGKWQHGPDVSQGN